ncbi:MAG TPA: hypothetical protein VLV86_21470 [Vicinamibacterales bacterium]|nr:hypothetical protein [Vicinamibacterales bacterium]
MVRRLGWVAIVCACSATVVAQRGGPPPPPRTQAPFDIMGYWVSLVNEDWRYRITMPPKGDFAGVPLNGAGRQAAAAWDPAKDEASGDACKAYGAGGVMRMPGRLHITWTTDDMLAIETDAGMQTRTIAFRGAGGEAGTWQGVSVGAWDRGDTAMSRGGFFPGAAVRGGSLRVVTTKMRAGYLRKNGVPYSSDAVMTEYFDRFDVPGGDSLLVISTEIVDPTYLMTPLWTSTHFKKQSDASGWNPRSCSSR